MASWPNHCSCARRAPLENPLSNEAALAARRRAASASLLLAVLAAACGQASTSPPRASNERSALATAGTEPTALANGGACVPSETGFLKARLQGAIDAEIDWAAPAVPQCLGAPRPLGDGIRLVYKGTLGDGPLLVVIGIVAPNATEVARNVPANLTLVREGEARFYATQGDDKCALDELTQVAVPGTERRYRVSGRGYCTSPARALGGDGGVVLVTRFDLESLVEYPRDDQELAGQPAPRD